MKSPRTRQVLLATVVLAVMISPFAVAATGHVLRENGRNPTATSETQIVGRIAGTDNNTGGYTTRQSNLSDTGGGAFYEVSLERDAEPLAELFGVGDSAPDA